MTTGISLVRENAASMQPPRSLWVPFPLGRPLGKPGDAAFQHRVIGAALALLGREAGPVLEDYAEDVPALDVESSPACPVSFAKPDPADTWQARLAREQTMLQPWYELGRRRRRGRTLVGVSGLAVEDNLRRLGDYLDRDQLPVDQLDWFKRAIEDAKIYYVEALTAQPGSYEQTAVYRTLWFETELGRGLRKFYEAFAAHPRLAPFARIVLPREAVGGTTGAVRDQGEPSP